MPLLKIDDSYRLLHLGSHDDSGQLIPDTENRFTNEWLLEIENILTNLEEESAAGNQYGLIIYAEGKFFSNGLEVALMLPPHNAQEYIARVQAVFARILVLGVPTVTAINGHAFGAGAMLPLCTDFAIMRTERGFISLPEAALKMPFPPGMQALITTVLSMPTAREAMLTSCRYPSELAVKAGIIYEQAPVESLLTRARSLIEPTISFSGKNYKSIKEELYKDLLKELTAPVPPLSFQG